LEKAMEALRSGPSWDEIRKTRLEADLHLKEFSRIVDDLKRSLR
jgi:hypothetical protein